MLPLLQVQGPIAIHIKKSDPVRFAVGTSLLDQCNDGTTTTNNNDPCSTLFVFAWKQITASKWNTFLPAKKQQITSALQWSSRVSISGTPLPKKENPYSANLQCSQYKTISQKILANTSAATPLLSDATSLFIDAHKTIGDSYYLFEIEVFYVNGETNQAYVGAYVERARPSVKTSEISVLISTQVIPGNTDMYSVNAWDLISLPPGSGIGDYNYSWRCFQRDGFLRPMCPDSIQFTDLSSHILGVKRTTLPPYQEFFFEIALFDRNFPQLGTWTAHYKVTTQGLPAPEVSINALTSSSSFRVNPDARMTLVPIIKPNDQTYKYQVTWQCTSSQYSCPNGYFGKNYGQPGDTVASQHPSVTVFQNSLIVSGQSTPLPIGATMSFQVTVYSPVMNGRSISTVTITSNSAPSNGICEIFPVNGTALNTTFTVTCSSWSDLDTPLQYALQYTSETSPAAGEVTVRNFVPDPQAKFSLPTGSHKIRVSIRDALGMETSVSLPAVKVFDPPATQRAEVITAFLADGLAQAETTTDVNKVRALSHLTACHQNERQCLLTTARRNCH